MCDGKPMKRTPGDLASSREIHHAMCPTCLESKRRIAELEDWHSSCARREDTLRARIAKLERTYEAHAAHARAAQSRYEKSLDRIAELTTELEEYTTHSWRQAERIAELEASAETADACIANQMARIAELEDSIEKMRCEE